MNRKTGKMSKKVILIISLIAVIAIALGSTIAFIITQSDVLKNTFKSGVEPLGDLKISKIVEHELGEDYDVPIRFEIEVDFGADWAELDLEEMTVQYGNEPAALDSVTSKGKLDLVLKPDQTVTVANIPAGTELTVTEKEYDGFATKVNGKRSNSIDITIPEWEEKEVVFVNKYEPEAAENDIKINGKKILDGREWKEGDAFSFILEQMDAKNEWKQVGDTEAIVRYELVPEDPMDPESRLVPKKDFDLFSLTEAMKTVVFDAVGSYTFRVREIDDAIGGITYDDAMHIFRVTVIDEDMDGKLEISSIENIENTTVDGRTVIVEMINKYAPAGSAVAMIDITKQLEDHSGQQKAPEGFSFELLDESGSVVNTSNITAADGKAAIKLVYEPDDAGKVFFYTLREVNCGESIGGIQYDDKEYPIMAEVIDNLDGAVSVEIKDRVPDEPSDDLQGVQQDDAQQDDAQQDDVQQDDAQQDDVQQDDVQQDDAQQDDVQQDDVQQDDAQQDDAQQDDVQQDDAQQDDAQQDDIKQEGMIVPAAKLAAASNVYSAVFKNEYAPKGDEKRIEGIKVLTGRKLKAEEFSFALYETEQDYVIRENVKPLQKTRNGKKGEIVFTLDYDKVGTHYYVVEENKGDLGGVIYDENAYRVKVDVADVGGKLIAEVKYIDDEIRFTNTYTPEPAEVEISGDVKLSGRELEEREFVIDLYPANEDFEPQGTPIHSERNEADGTYAFEKTAYDTEGDYWFILKQNSTEPLDGVEYDKAIYGVHISVRDNGEGELIAEVKYYKFVDGEKYVVETIEFHNIYSAKATSLVIEGEKKLTGANLTDGAFRFMLYDSDEGYTKLGENPLTSVNDGEGRFAFDALTFKQVGTYYYIVVEDTSAAQEFITYDDTKYGVKIVVTDPGKGMLKAEQSIEKIGGESVAGIVFNNKYVPRIDDVMLEVGIRKTVRNIGTDSIGPEKFEFILENITNGTSETEKTDIVGLAEFQLVYSELDAGKTYSYLLREVDDGRDGVTYSKVTYEFDVSVTLTEENQLEAVLTHEGKTVDGLLAEFENVFNKSSKPDEPIDDPKPTPPPGGSNEDPEAPQEPLGDSSNIYLYIALACASGLIVIVILLLIPALRRKKDDQ